MRSRAGRTPDQLIAATARPQFGIVSFRQLIACGLTKSAILHRVESGRLERILPRVYRVPGAPDSWEQRLMAAYLWASDGVSAISHRSAAALWGLAGIDRDRVEISTTGRVRGRAPDVVVHRVGRLLPEEIRYSNNLALTSPPRTVIDLCGTDKPWVAERAFDDALRKEDTTLQELGNYLRLEARQGRRGVTLMREILMARDSNFVPPDSQLERDLERLLIGSGLPQPVRQHPLFKDGRLMRVYDFAYPDVCLGIEAQSYEHHDGRLPWSKDQTKDNAANILGWATLRYTYYDIRERPQEVVEEVRATLEQRRTLFRAP
jgi:predicted transcriptional regulator of viral defense system/very-short-patch-repair endonuclease